MYLIKGFTHKLSAFTEPLAQQGVCIELYEFAGGKVLAYAYDDFLCESSTTDLN